MQERLQNGNIVFPTNSREKRQLTKDMNYEILTKFTVGDDGSLRAAASSFGTSRGRETGLAFKPKGLLLVKRMFDICTCVRLR